MDGDGLIDLRPGAAGTAAAAPATTPTPAGQEKDIARVLESLGLVLGGLVLRDGRSCRLVLDVEGGRVVAARAEAAK
jgi:hypothetical protein